MLRHSWFVVGFGMHRDNRDVVFRSYQGVLSSWLFRYSMFPFVRLSLRSRPVLFVVGIVRISRRDFRRTRSW